MTMRDIAELRVNEMEELLEGLNENTEREERELEDIRKGKSRRKPAETLTGDDAIKALMGGFGA